jgi:2,3-diaminopropionate biosynthesis protein SbnB
MFDFHVISATVIADILRSQPGLCLDSVEQAYLAHHDGKTVNPDSYFLRFPQQPANRIIALPAALTDEVAGIKWIASFPGNVQQGVPRASAVLLLNDPHTGYPYACMEGALISAARTAASAVLGARHLNQGRRRQRSIAFIGAGVIARSIYDMFLADDWQFEQALVHDADPASAAALVAHIGASDHMPARAETSLGAALEADIVVFATSAGTPYVLPPLAFAAGQIVLNISLRDLAPELILAADNYFDDVEHCMKAQTSPHLAEQLAGNRGFVSGTLAELIRGERQVNGARPQIFSPFGMGMLDLALGRRIYAAARDSGQALAVADFFGELKRW